MGPGIMTRGGKPWLSTTRWSVSTPPIRRRKRPSRHSRRRGLTCQKLSIVGKDAHTEEHVVGYYNAGDRMQFWGTLGAFWGWLGGLLVGGALFVIPGLGPVIVLGPLVGGLVGALGGAVVVGGLSALGAGLYSIGIPRIALWSTRRPSSRPSSS